MANRKELTPQDREYLENILDMDLSNLEDEHIAVIRARRSYLTKEELEKFAAVLEEKKEKKEEKEEKEEKPKK